MIEIKPFRFEVGESVDWITADNELVRGTVLKVYESTFGSKKKDVALQIKLEKKRYGRNITTVRAKNCIHS